MAKLFNRAKMTTSTTGTGTITLGSASNGFQSFADAGVANGDVVQYVIEEGANFEIGTGTYTSSGTTLTRSPTESSNSDAAITLAGQATVSITAVAADMNRLQHNGSDKVTVSATGASVTGNISVTGTVDGRDIATDGSKLDGIESGATADQTAAEIRAKVEAASDSNVFTDADHTKLNGIATNANNYSLPLSSSSTRGGVKIGYTENGKNYPVELSSEQMFVNVPWTDTNTTYSAGSGLSLSGTTFSVSSAPKWTTARTLSLSGDASGSVSWDGSANATLSVDVGNANSVDGYSVSTTRNAANTIPVRDGSGYLQLGWINTTSGATTSTIAKIYGTYSGDNYIRYFTPATLISQQGIWTSSNDGSGSGLDADLLDGVQGSSYLRSDQNDTFAGQLTVSTTNDAQIKLTSSDSWTGIGFDDGASTGTQYIWHNGANGTFAIGGGGSNVSGKKLHIDGGTTIGVNYDATSTHTNGLKVEGHIETAGEYYAPNKIIHTGDTNTYMQFHAADQWRVVTGGTERLEVNNTNTTVANNLIVSGNLTVNGTAPAASAVNDIFWENGQTVTSNYTITNGKNAMSAGPITVNSGVTVTVGSGETWTVV